MRRVRRDININIIYKEHSYILCLLNQYSHAKKNNNWKTDCIFYNKFTSEKY